MVTCRLGLWRRPKWHARWRLARPALQRCSWPSVASAPAPGASRAGEQDRDSAPERGCRALPGGREARASVARGPLGSGTPASRLAVPAAAVDQGPGRGSRSWPSARLRLANKTRPGEGCWSPSRASLEGARSPRPEPVGDGQPWREPASRSAGEASWRPRHGSIAREPDAGSPCATGTPTAAGRGDPRAGPRGARAIAGHGATSREAPTWRARRGTRPARSARCSGPEGRIRARSWSPPRAGVLEARVEAAGPSRAPWSG